MRPTGVWRIVNEVEGNMPRVDLLCRIGLLVVFVTAGCASSAQAPAPSSNQPAAPQGSSSAQRTKHVTAAMMGEPTTLVDRMNSTQISVPGGRVLEMLVNSALTELNGDAKLHPLLAESVPTIENGGWKLSPDGTMETTWKLKPNLRWHDGAPVTAEDFVFATTVDQDKEMPLVRPLGYNWVQSVTAPDPSTVVVAWSGLYIDADTMFTGAFAPPLPKHLLEEAYQRDKTSFLALPYWSQEFVGTGPFRLRQFNPGTSVLLQANDDYALGRPKIDEFEVRFILDSNTLVTNLLSGSVEMSLGRGFSTENALQLRDQWKDGRMLYRTRLWIALHPQYIDPNPAILGDLRFRQALMYATDRQQLVDSLQGGLGGVGHVFIGPAEPEYADVQDSAVKYDFDPARAARMIEALGYAKGPDGIYRDAANARLTVEVRSNGERITENTIVPLTNMWNQVGIAAEPLLVPVQRITDREYVATFPGFRMMRQPNAAASLARLRSTLTPLPENRFVGSNYARYMSPEFDTMIDTFNATIPRPERMNVLRQIMRYFSENLVHLGLFYDGDFMFANNRLLNVAGNETEIWDILQWDIQA
jgi:peptide/nickel transport system substrate-binding protein